jgi:flagellar assembly protein FliH
VSAQGGRNSGASPILRDVVVNAQPHTLARPARAQLHLADASDATTASAINADTAIARARDEGYAAGRFEAERDMQAALAAAKEDAREEGLKQADERLEKACAQAVDEIRAEARARFERIDALAARLREEVEARIADSEEDMVALAFEAACRVIGEKAVEPETLHGIVKVLAATHAHTDALDVHIHPGDLATMREWKGESTDTWRWVADESVRMGGAVLRGPRASLDARLETQLQNLREALVSARARRRSVA